MGVILYTIYIPIRSFLGLQNILLLYEILIFPYQLQDLNCFKPIAFLSDEESVDTMTHDTETNDVCKRREKTMLEEGA